MVKDALNACDVMNKVVDQIAKENGQIRTFANTFEPLA